MYQAIEKLGLMFLIKTSVNDRNSLVGTTTADEQRSMFSNMDVTAHWSIDADRSLLQKYVSAEV